MISRTGLVARTTRTMLACLLAMLAACGGGSEGGSTPAPGNGGGDGNNNGGGGGGGTTTGQPAIFASVLLIAPAPSQASMADGFVGILNQAGTAAVTNAVVKFNNTTLAYDASDEAYVGEFPLVAGQQVNLSVVVGGITYTASAAMHNHYPAITDPSADTLWNSRAAHRVRWSSIPNANANHMFFLAGYRTEGWPANGIIDLPASLNSYDIPADALAPDDYLVLVGLSEEFLVPAARPGSELRLAMFGYQPVTVERGNVPTVRDLFIENVINPLSIGVGSSRVLGTIAIDDDNLRQEVTTTASWSSSDPAVVSVAAGRITGLAAGNAVVTASFGGRSTTRSITVYALPPQTQQPAPLRASVTFQGDHAHTGYLTVGGSGPSLPFTGKWSVNLGGMVSYPLVANGRVFVTVAGAPAGQSGLYALDVGTGAVAWGPVGSSTHPWLAPAYDHGKLFVVDYGALLRSFDAATGSAGWSLQLPVNMAMSAPVVRNGILYVAAGDSLFAVDAQTGKLLWNYHEAGRYGSPAVTGDGVFLAGYKLRQLDPWSGGVKWTAASTCSIGLGFSPVVAQGRVFSRGAKPSSDCNGGPASLSAIVDAANGAVLGQFDASVIPAVANGRAFYGEGSKLTAVDVATGNTLWSFTGGGQVAPLVIDNLVVTGLTRYTSGTIYVLDAATGAQLWSDTVPDGLERPMEYSGAFSGFGAGDGYLLVPAGRTLTGWKIVP